MNAAFRAPSAAIALGLLAAAASRSTAHGQQASTPAPVAPVAPASPPPTATPPTANGAPMEPRIVERGLTDDDAVDGLDVPLHPGDRARPPQQPPFSLGAGYIHQFDAGIGDGGTMAVDRFYASFSSRLVTTDDFTLTLAMGYENGWYHWSGNNPLGVAEPWGTVNLFGLQARGSWRVDREWVVTAGGIFALAGESDADAGSSIYGGGLASVSWAPNQDTVLGIGVLGVTQIENNPIVIPVPVLHWRFAPEWVVSTIRRPPASPFVGIDVAWEPEGSKLDVALGVGWQQRRFRLGPNSDPTIDNGVGLDQSWAAFLSAGWDIVPGLRVDGLVGLQFSETLELQDSSGRSQRNASVDPNALLGVFVTWNF
jgi:hypothetical protein